MPPGPTTVAALGTPLNGTSIREPARVAVWVLPWLEALREVPYRKLAVVPDDVTFAVEIPPRMPSAPDGVLITTSLFLLIAPPTKRNVPRGTLSAISPV